MGILGWIVVGFIAGGLARRVTGSAKRGCLGTIAVGVIGALVGGALYRWATGTSADAFDDFNLESLVVAFLGAVLFLFVLDALGGRSRRR